MVGQAIQQSIVNFSGLRPFDASRDMDGVARLLEQAFREDLGFFRAMSRVPLLRQLGMFIWAASLTPALSDSFVGFVWEENRRIVGNVTLTPDDMRRRHWMISNVAVDEKFRRRGIARQLMEAAIDEAQRHRASWLILNVRPHNASALELYNNLGFEAIDTEMNYVQRRAATPDTPLRLRALKGAERRAAFELARAGMSEKLKMFRPLRMSEFGVHFEDRLAERVLDTFIGQSTERWGYFEEGQLRATVSLHAQRFGSPHTLDLRVAPHARGRLEEGLVAFALRRLAQFPRREISTRVLTSHGELVEALGREGFIPTRGLRLMALEMK